MSCYEWEHGSFLLPSAEVGRIKGALRAIMNLLHDDVRTKAVAVHKAIGTSSRSRYEAGLRAQSDSFYQQIEQAERSFHSARHRDTSRERLIHACAIQVLEQMLYTTSREGKSIRQPQVADVARIVPKMTNRDNEFPILGKHGYGEGSITFDGRKVTYAVPENNHAVDDANESVITVTFFTLLDSLTWTRGTGGHTMGNNEYNENESGYGRDADYIVRCYGPLGRDRQVHDYISRGFSRKQAIQFVGR